MLITNKVSHPTNKLQKIVIWDMKIFLPDPIGNMWCIRMFKYSWRTLKVIEIFKLTLDVVSLGKDSDGPLSRPLLVSHLYSSSSSYHNVLLFLTHRVNLGSPGVGTDPIKLARRAFSHRGTQQLSEIKSAENLTP